MGDFIRLPRGAPPWGDDGPLLRHAETLHFHDGPLIGLIEQSGVSYLFRCLVGEIEPLNLWSYTLVEPSEIAQLESAESVVEFDYLVESFARRPGVVAIALDGFGVIESGEVEDWSNPETHLPPLLDAVEALERRIQAQVETQRHRLVATG